MILILPLQGRILALNCNLKMRLRLEALYRDVSSAYIYGTAASAFQSITECHKTWQFATYVSTAECPPFCVKQQTYGQHTTFITTDCAIPQCRLQPFTLQNTAFYAAECGLLQHQTRLNATPIYEQKALKTRLFAPFTAMKNCTACHAASIKACLHALYVCTHFKALFTPKRFVFQNNAK